MPAITRFDLVDADTLGTTTGTKETLGSITTEATTSDIMSMFFQAVSTGTRTTAEATQGEFLVDTGGLVPQVLRVPTAYTEGGAPATNIQGYFDNGRWLPFSPDGSKNLGNHKINVDFDTALESTTEYAAQFGLLYSTTDYDPKIIQNALGTVMSHRVRNVTTATEPDLGNATSEAFPESHTAEGGLYDKIVAIGHLLAPDAVLTAGEHLLGNIEYSGTLNGLQRQKLPIPAIGASLGTPVGESLFCRELMIPTFWTLDGINQTINMTANLQATTTGVFQLTSSLYYA